MTSNANLQYTILLFRRQTTFAVQTESDRWDIEESDQDRALTAAWDRHVESEYRERLTDWETELQAFRERTSGDRFDVKTGNLGKRMSTEMVRLKFPDSATSREVPLADAESIVLREFVRMHGEKPEVSQAAWTFEEHPSAERLMRWVCSAYQPDGTYVPNVDVDLSNWSSGAPLQGIAAILNRYGAEGWTVVEWTEDKGLYDGLDARNESFPVRIRIVLTKSHT